MLAQVQPVVTRHVVEIVDRETEEAVHIIDVAGLSDHGVERIVRSLTAQMNRARYFWRKVREIDEDRWRADMFAIRHAGSRYGDGPGPWLDARGLVVEPFADDVPWLERQVADLLRWGFITEEQAAVCQNFEARIRLSPPPVTNP